jgi:hypothetical protein
MALPPIIRRTSALEKGPLLGDELSMPAKQGGGGHDGIEIAQGFSADFHGQARKRSTLCVGEHDSTLAESSPKCAILRLQVFDPCSRLSLKPARYACGDQSKEGPRPYQHRSILPVAQSHLQFEFSNSTRCIGHPQSLRGRHEAKTAHLTERSLNRFVSAHLDQAHVHKGPVQSANLPGRRGQAIDRARPRRRKWPR